MFNIKTRMDTLKIQVNTSNNYTQAYRVETDSQQVKTQNCCSHSSKTTPSVGYPQNLGGGARLMENSGGLASPSLW